MDVETMRQLTGTHVANMNVVVTREWWLLLLPGYSDVQTLTRWIFLHFKERNRSNQSSGYCHCVPMRILATLPQSLSASWSPPPRWLQRPNDIISVRRLLVSGYALSSIFTLSGHNHTTVWSAPPTAVLYYRSGGWKLAPSNGEVGKCKPL